MGAAHLNLQQVSKSFRIDGNPLTVLDDFSLSAAPGEFVCLLGASGCGKSTLLRLVLGLEQADSGALTLDGQSISGPGRDRGIVFQDHRLFPWLNLTENIALALHHSGLSRQEQQARVDSYLKLVGLYEFRKARPAQISGGMAQRAAIARALVAEPKLLLLDEPFGALDALTRYRLQEELLRIWQRDRPSVLMVTHDIDEALYLADRIVVLQANPGRIKRVINVDLERPRQRQDPRLISLREEILSLFDWQAIDRQ
ncbi:ABC transporter ATP-binding protein [Pseudomonas sp. 5P_3.1_Bac2]|uniref:ABC transporter ATP-binding protein n=1 Tax=Pseudomonas sp. 5P_3.1_Bac2 TaxID=2971617 RepID=UPI0021CA835A|nr:ABC transporter ATP-binding protein [Pseudomonas sp. 5P_3.1_Bac2]MCU1718189.1 ABC transporter ATP-binding protein [Pseudomonas sp. 5P_3.1_Bac2]